MKGKDGRFYDPHFDLDHDGKLDISELMIMEEVIFGSDEEEEEDDEIDLMTMTKEERREAIESGLYDEDDFDDYEDDYEDDYDDENDYGDDW